MYVIFYLIGDTMRIGLTIGHAGRLSRINDRGAYYNGQEEVSLVRRYTDELDKALRSLGHECIMFSDGQYSEQWLRVDNAKCDIYFNCHINAGKGNYGLFLYDYRSTEGKRLAENITLAFKEQIPTYAVRALPCRPDTNGTPRDGDFSEAFSCIQGVRAVALCIEPYFIDSDTAKFFIDNPGTLAHIVAIAIDNYAKQKETK